MNLKSLGLKLGSAFALVVSAAFAHGAANDSAANAKDIAVERAARVRAIQTVNSDTPLYFSQVSRTHGQNVNWHSSHQSHRSHSSHYSHRSGY